FDPNKGFLLASGQKSDVYIDVKKTVLFSEGITLTGEIVFDMIKDDDVAGIGGLTLGADPIAYATAFASNLKGKALSVFIVRKETKAHGTQRKIEMPFEAGTSVVVIDDVVTTGGSTIKAIEGARDAGLIVKKVVALVDREEGGRENIEAHCPFEAVFTKTDLLNLRKKRG
ncbi:MAG: orotate phosphoribosyltransferase, partial [Deltaproteobacteria bacterium]|nr:orotate phosphoribosyltransferase [Deltaproteobacteria bacterium]